MKIIPTHWFIICANFIRPPNNLKTINTAICADSCKPDLKILLVSANWLL